ncbi:MULTISPECIES: SDR family NAD(P)-dependent oxidoreductase [Mesonia]|uniref:3-oxoacyl-[acyl-carrier-protein] reductase FabG n=1 Tax=Mesonia oceanica TaxID=2687242 RepID=A0AC61Y8C8_9FLAO|nr:MULTISPECIES: SDR family oxidoreductase [Mesonia]MAN27592.1 short-chain dehydrogenase [Mesonia sp.]MAQ40197.1 short-chain dehydrogenase [Mesonia sp.]MBJ97108.1 short-chain dehydrogenase [Flavobacteriaceae bacterium]VVV00624.1 3-oxoacyl-[acyl-carrier-protein] reductase FabG [Mesonia oceanica]|tara:strand:+ start:8303 stop:9061 length:759 start_codon:yes stop_codon:yes gene_type:complete
MNHKLVLITGGSRGLGKNMALKVAEKGLDVILTYHQNKEEAHQVVSAIKDKGQRAVALQLDTSNTSNFLNFQEELQRVLSEVFKVKKIDFLVNNAGIGINEAFAETSEATFDKLVNIHLKGVFFLTQQLLPMLANEGGIINISSGLARFTMHGYSAYGAMKAAVESLTRYQAKELGKRGIRSNVVAPGAIETDFGGGLVRDNKDVNKIVSSQIPLGRVGQSDDIGGVVAFLCTEEAKWINGQRIEVSGGQNL